MAFKYQDIKKLKTELHNFVAFSLKLNKLVIII